jgi:hypothetical protein
MLRGAGLLDVPHAAVHLDAIGGHPKRLFARPSLEDGDEQLRHTTHVFAVVGTIEQVADEHRQRAHGEHLARHGAEQAAHIGMLGDRRARRTLQHTPLQSAGGIRGGALVRTMRDAGGLVAHAQAGGVHHHEHARESAIELSDEVARRVLI